MLVARVQQVGNDAQKDEQRNSVAFSHCCVRANIQLQDIQHLHRPATRN